ncbi:unnamed protein product [Urochloa humidicola]
MGSSPGENNKDLHKEVLDGIVTANGFFTGAVFLSVTGTVTPLSDIPSNCMAGADITRNLFLFQIWSLGFYFLSSLIATASKLVIFHIKNAGLVIERVVHVENGIPSYSGSDARRNTKTPPVPYVRSVMFSAVGSVFLLLSIINLVQIKLGLLSCGNTLVLITGVGIALLIIPGLAIYLIISGWFLKWIK